MAASFQAPAAEARPSGLASLSLENGDQLSAHEFLRRYEAMPGLKKAELIEGIVYMASPVRAIHGEPDALIQTWLGYYAAQTPGTRLGTNMTVYLDADNVPQPDALLRLLPECGGRSQVGSDGYLHGPPELIVEIAASSASIDLRDKLRAYRRAGVHEYLVWRSLEAQFDWLVLDRDEYTPNLPGADKLIHSPHWPGLCLEVEALLAMNAAKVLQSLQSTLNSQAHQAFIAQLQKSPPQPS